MTDERQGKPSASSMERISLCLGSLALCNAHPSNNSTKDSRAGDNVHGLIERHIKGERAVVASEGPESKTAAEILVKAAPVVQQWRDAHPGDEEIFVEHRFWCCGDFSAKMDLVFKRGAAALILDWKSGWGDVTPAQDNLQLCAQAVALAFDDSTDDVMEVSVAIIQAHKPVASLVVYDDKALEDAESHLTLDIVRPALKPNQPRIPGEKQCTYCPAKLHCPEAKQDMAQLTTVEPNSITDPIQISKLLERCSMATKMVEAIRSNARALMKSGIEIPGYRLAPNNREKVANIFGVWNKLQNYTTPDEFAKRVTMTKKDLEELVTELRPDLKGKQRDAFLRLLLEGNTETVIGEQKLVKK